MQETLERMVPSDEGDSRGLQLGRDEGAALGRTLDHMLNDIAEHGEEKRAGEYLVALAIEKAEGLWIPTDEGLEWCEPERDNLHVEVAVRDPADGRFIPGLEVTVAVFDADGELVGRHVQPLLWHPYLYHYGRDWAVPGNGRYNFVVEIARPDFPRHDRRNGFRFLDGAECTFDNVSVKAGKG